MGFQSLRLFGAVGLAFDFEDDRAFDKPVEESHRKRTIDEIISPLFEIHVGDHRGGSFLISRGNDLVK